MLRKYLKTYDELCKRFSSARLLYRTIVEPVMHHSRRREYEVLEKTALEVRRYYSSAHWLLYTRLIDLINKKRICVLGPLSDYSKNYCKEYDTIIVVDGALWFNLDRPVIYVGDLDSSCKDYLLNLCSNESRNLCLAHVHGDNVERILEFIGYTNSHNVLYTSQIDCFWPIIGIGGYTDGDRAILLAMALGAKEIIIDGFDFSMPTCHHKQSSRIECSKIKELKLELARRLVLSGSLVYGYDIINQPNSLL